MLFALKSTLAFLLMLVGAIPITLFAKRKTNRGSLIAGEMRFHWRAVWTFLVVFVGACLLSPMTISIRHFSVPIVLLILLLAPVPRALALLFENGWPMARFVMAGYVILAAVCVGTMVRAYPYYFPFVNSLGFGRPAYILVSDSNLIGMPMPGNVDPRVIFLNCERDPNQLQPTMDHMMAQYRTEQEKRKQIRGR